jgi:GT2 family glycosyltransferase
MMNTRAKNKKTISIVVVTYNSSDNIIPLLKSLKSSSNIIREIIIIENDSPDKQLTTKNVIDYSKNNKIQEIQYILSEHNDGFAKSCNRGAKIANGEYILFLNPDTKIKLHSLSTLLAHAIDNKADIIGGLAMNIQGQPHNAAVRAPTLMTGLFEFTNLGKLFGIKFAHQHFYYEDIRILESVVDKKVHAVSGAYLLVQKKSFQKLDGFDESYFMYLEDVDLGIRANKMNMKVFFCPHSKIIHEGGASSLNKYNIHHQAWYDSRKKYYRKNFGYISNTLIQPLFFIEEMFLKTIRSHK